MAPRPLFALLILSLSGCAQQPVQTSLCGMGPEFRTWQGTVVRIKAMLVPGGEERTAGEYAELLEPNGFKLTQVVPTDSAVSVVEAVRA